MDLVSLSENRNKEMSIAGLNRFSLHQIMFACILIPGVLICALGMFTVSNHGGIAGQSLHKQSQTHQEILQLNRNIASAEQSTAVIRAQLFQLSSLIQHSILSESKAAITSIENLGLTITAEIRQQAEFIKSIKQQLGSAAFLSDSTSKLLVKISRLQDELHFNASLNKKLEIAQKSLISQVNRSQFASAAQNYLTNLQPTVENLSKRIETQGKKVNTLMSDVNQFSTEVSEHIYQKSLSDIDSSSSTGYFFLFLISAGIIMGILWVARNQFVTPFQQMHRGLMKLATTQPEFKPLAQRFDAYYIKRAFDMLIQNLSNTGTSEQDQALITGLEQASQPIMIANNNHEVVFANQACHTFFDKHQSSMTQAFGQVSNLSSLSILQLDTQKAAFEQDLVQLKSMTETQIQVGETIMTRKVTPLHNGANQRVGTIVEWQEYASGEEPPTRQDEAMNRIKLALDVCQANVMMADNDMNIVYLNESVHAMMRKNQSELQTHISNFDSEKLIGTCVDVFHKDPSHQRRMIADLKQVYNTRLEVGCLTFDLTATPIFDKGNRLGTVVEWEDITDILAKQREEQKLAQNNERIKRALDVCQANVMMADNDFNIVYLNDSVEKMMQTNQETLRIKLPNFDASKLLGTCVDTFHADPSYQRNIVGGMTEVYNTRLELAGLTFDLIATPVFSDNGERLGTVVEWDDITESLARQQFEQRMAEDNARIKRALDVCQANVMMADNDFNIVYVNESVQRMMKSNQETIKIKLPNFNAETLLGTCVDTFHADPSYQRNMVGAMTEVYNTRLELAGLTFDLIATPVFSDEGDRLGTVVEWDDITESLARQKAEQQLAQDNARIKRALDVCQANVMMADNDFNIVYTNDSVEKMMKSNEAKIKTHLPNFDAESLIGTCVDTFHKEPSYQRNMVSAMKEVYNTRLEISGLTFDLIATPVFSDDGERLGTVVEWNDITESLARQLAEQKLAQANARTKRALDVCQANVMMADNDFNIVYMNNSVEKMMKSNEEKLRMALPQFNADKLLGTCVDIFHKQPSYQRDLVANMTDVYNTRLKLTGLTFDLIATPVFSDEGERLGTVVEWNDITEELARAEEEQRIARENLRIKQALDNVATNTMIGDRNNNIIYMNNSIHTMMKNAERDIQKDLPNFNSNKLIGENIDQFHKNPSHQQRMIEALTSTYKTEIMIGGRTFGLIANPINDEGGERIGTVVEWTDRTDEVAIEKEINQLIDSASDGDLTLRIQEEDKEGFFLNLSKGLNQLVGIAEGVINDTVTVLDAMAHGDLTKSITTDYHGLYGKLKQDANTTVEKLTEVIARINNAAGLVASGAEEIEQGNTDLSQRTESQASSLEETAASMEEMTGNVRQSSENAKEANTLAIEAKNKAEEGGQIVSQAIQGMEEINESSKKINDIIGVIDEIAFQTNLLALNAAVEAARAGEQGRGFAVVAGEVRNLAQRSSGAAKEIKDLIRDSVNKVEFGTDLVNQSGETLNEIVDSVQHVSQMVAEISHAAIEQTSGIEQVNTAVMQMDEMTQRNAALVEEVSAAGEAMADQARDMRNILSFFTTNERQ
nr:methyl-accepting chemotaxis protein [Algicola sagamiensis]